MWIGVTKRFTEFYGNIRLTDDQLKDGRTKHAGVRKRLNSYYHGLDSETANSFLVGSWGKLTHTRPPRDIDLYFELPPEVYNRLQNHTGNRQSALLQEVKLVLETTYPTTAMRGDGQVVVVKFSSMNVEVVPVFCLTSGQYYVCNTHDGGSYMAADPKAEEKYISTVHAANNNNLRPIVRMLKTWQQYCGVPLKSFQLELLAADYLTGSPWRQNGYFYYDWLMRDFFAYLLTKEHLYVTVPGTGELIWLGDEWKSRCESAYSRALKACEYETKDMVIHAGEEWQKIFGNQIPKNV